jgi:hypothetical protein
LEPASQAVGDEGLQSGIAMKDRILIYVSLILSLTALAYAAWVHHQGSEVLAMQALRRREAELVRHWAPNLNTAYRDMLPDYKAVATNATTLEELLAPLVKMMEQVGSLTDVTNRTNGLPR